MIGLLGLLSVVAGTVAAYMAERFPARVPIQVEAVQTTAGVLLIGGFALAGAGLPVVL